MLPKRWRGSGPNTGGQYARFGLCHPPRSARPWISMKRNTASPQARRAGRACNGKVNAIVSASRRRSRKGGRRSTRTRSVPAPGDGQLLTVTVGHLGARGDGIAETPDGPLYIPNAAPGDVLKVLPGAVRGDGRSATIVALAEPGPARADPVCRHAAECGGCVLQHLDETAQARFKRESVVAALQRKGFDPDCVRPLRSVPPGARRRVRLVARRLKDRVVLGFNERAGAKVIDLAECPVSDPRVAALLPALRALLSDLPSFGQGGDVQITLSDTGSELVFIPDEEADPGLEERARLTAFAETQDAARLAWQRGGLAEPVAARRTPSVMLGGRAVALPMGGFLQPSAAGAAILTELVLEAVPAEADPVADFYCGVGTFALPLAARGTAVHAAEGDGEAVAALRRAGAGLRLAVEQRDIARDPPDPTLLDRFAAVVFDPPRAGAAALADRLAKSAVPRLVAVSCNPSTLARDLRRLVEGGYQLAHVTPVDQFPWSAHVEAVAVLSRSDG